MTSASPPTAAVDSVHSDDREVLTESALRGERTVAALRIGTWLILGFSSAVIGALSGEPRESNPWRGAVIAGWAIFSLVTFFVLRRVRFTPRRALWWPIAFMLVDYSVLVFVNLVSARGTRPEVGAGVLAIILAFSVVRFSGLHIWLSAALAIAGVVVQAVALDWFNARSVTMVASSYIVLAGTVYWVNREIRRMFVAVRRRDHLARFLPPQVASRVLEEGGAALQPVKREVTILFSDLRDFTRMSQRMDPAEVLSLLDEYFARMGAVVKRHGGMLNKFIGDGMLAVWGVPDVQPDHARRAISAALAMREEVAALNRERAARNQPELRIGVGIHSGEVAAGMLGGSDQHEYTVLGDAVNLASRIEGLTRTVGTDLLVSARAWELAEGAFDGERVGSEVVKGRDEPVLLYRVSGAARRAA